jgi:hypothetical protein
MGSSGLYERMQISAHREERLRDPFEEAPTAYEFELPLRSFMPSLAKEIPWISSQSQSSGLAE